MIISRIWGGLGNQMFQYSFGYAIARKLRQELKLDISYFENNSLRPYRLNNFNLDYKKTLANKEIPLGIQAIRSRLPNKLIRIFPKFKMRLPNGWTYIKETRFEFNPTLQNIEGDNIYLDGYWQCEKYFLEYSNDISRQMTPVHKNSEEFLYWKSEIDQGQSVSVHIRRGDFLYQERRLLAISHLYLLGIEYYNRAIEFFSRNVDNPVYYFFSDDIEWAKEQFSFLGNSRFIKIETPYGDIDEIRLMSICKHHIVANSTFSWWGAWLDNKPHPKILAPERYYGNKDIVPENWHKIEIEKKKEKKDGK